MSCNINTNIPIEVKNIINDLYNREKNDEMDKTSAQYYIKNYIKYRNLLNEINNDIQNCTNPNSTIIPKYNSILQKLTLSSISSIEGFLSDPVNYKTSGKNYIPTDVFVLKEQLMNASGGNKKRRKSSRRKRVQSRRRKTHRHKK
jgi:hypothetical protein